MSEIFFNSAGMRNIGNEISGLLTLITDLREELAQIRNRLDVELYQRFINEFTELDENFSDIADKLTVCVRYLPGAEEAYVNAENAIKSELKRIYSEFYYYHTKLDFLVSNFISATYRGSDFENYFSKLQGLALVPAPLPSDFPSIPSAPAELPRLRLTVAFAPAIFSIFIPEELIKHVEENNMTLSVHTGYLEYIPNAYMLPDMSRLLPAADGHGVNGDFVPRVIGGDNYRETNAAYSRGFEHVKQSVAGNKGFTPKEMKSAQFRYMPKAGIASSKSGDTTRRRIRRFKKTSASTALRSVGQNEFKSARFSNVRSFTHSASAKRETLSREKMGFKEVTVSSRLRNIAIKSFSDASFRRIRKLRLVRGVREIQSGLGRYSAGFEARGRSRRHAAGIFEDSEFQYAEAAKRAGNARYTKENFKASEFQYSEAAKDAVNARYAKEEFEDAGFENSEAAKDAVNARYAKEEFEDSAFQNSGAAKDAGNARYTKEEFEDSDFQNSEAAKDAVNARYAKEEFEDSAFQNSGAAKDAVNARYTKEEFEDSAFQNSGAAKDAVNARYTKEEFEDSAFQNSEAAKDAVNARYTKEEFEDSAFQNSEAAKDAVNARYKKEEFEDSVFQNSEAAKDAVNARYTKEEFEDSDFQNSEAAKDAVNARYTKEEFEDSAFQNSEAAKDAVNARYKKEEYEDSVFQNSEDAKDAVNARYTKEEFEDSAFQNSEAAKDAVNARYTRERFEDFELQYAGIAENAANTIDVPNASASVGRLDFDGLDEYFINAETSAIEGRKIEKYKELAGFAFIEDTGERLPQTDFEEAKKYADFIPAKLLPEFNNSYRFENVEVFQFVEDTEGSVIPAVAITGYLADIDGFKFVEDGTDRAIQAAGISDYSDYDGLVKVEKSGDIIIDADVEADGEYISFENNAIKQNKFKSAAYTENEQFAGYTGPTETVPKQSISSMLPFIAETYFFEGNNLHKQINRELKEFQNISGMIFGDRAQKIPKTNLSEYYDYFLNDKFIRQQRSIPPAFSGTHEEYRFERIVRKQRDTRQNGTDADDTEGFMVFSAETVSSGDTTSDKEETRNTADFTDIGFTSSGVKQVDDICEQIISGEMFGYSYAEGSEVSNRLNQISGALKEDYQDYETMKKAAAAVLEATVAYIANELITSLLSKAMVEADEEEKSINETKPQFDLEYREVEVSSSGKKQIQAKRIIGNINGKSSREIRRKMSKDVAAGVIDAVEHTEYELTEPKKIKLYLQNLYEQSLSGGAGTGASNMEDIASPALKGGGNSLVEVEYKKADKFFGIKLDEETADKLTGIIAISTAAQLLEAAGKSTVLKLKKTGKNKKNLKAAVEEQVKRFDSTMSTVSEFVADVLGIE